MSLFSKNSSGLRARVMEIVEARLKVAEENHLKRVEGYKVDYVKQLELVHQNFKDNKQKSEDLAVGQALEIRPLKELLNK